MTCLILITILLGINAELVNELHLTSNVDVSYHHQNDHTKSETNHSSDEHCHFHCSSLCFTFNSFSNFSLQKKSIKNPVIIYDSNHLLFQKDVITNLYRPPIA